MEPIKAQFSLMEGGRLHFKEVDNTSPPKLIIGKESIRVHSALIGWLFSLIGGSLKVYDETSKKTAYVNANSLKKRIFPEKKLQSISLIGLKWLMKDWVEKHQSIPRVAEAPPSTDRQLVDILAPMSSRLAFNFKTPEEKQTAIEKGLEEIKRDPMIPIETKFNSLYIMLKEQAKIDPQKLDPIIDCTIEGILKLNESQTRELEKLANTLLAIGQSEKSAEMLKKTFQRVLTEPKNSDRTIFLMRIAQKQAPIDKEGAKTTIEEVLQVAKDFSQQIEMAQLMGMIDPERSRQMFKEICQKLVQEKDPLSLLRKLALAQAEVDNIEALKTYEKYLEKKNEPPSFDELLEVARIESLIASSRATESLGKLWENAENAEKENRVTKFIEIAKLSAAIGSNEEKAIKEALNLAQREANLGIRTNLLIQIAKAQIEIEKTKSPPNFAPAKETLKEAQDSFFLQSQNRGTEIYFGSILEIADYQKEIEKEEGRGFKETGNILNRAFQWAEEVGSFEGLKISLRAIKVFAAFDREKAKQLLLDLLKGKAFADVEADREHSDALHRALTDTVEELSRAQ